MVCKYQQMIGRGRLDSIPSQCTCTLLRIDQSFVCFTPGYASYYSNDNFRLDGVIGVGPFATAEICEHMLFFKLSADSIQLSLGFFLPQVRIRWLKKIYIIIITGASFQKERLFCIPLLTYNTH